MNDDDDDDGDDDDDNNNQHYWQDAQETESLPVRKQYDTFFHVEYIRSDDIPQSLYLTIALFRYRLLHHHHHHFFSSCMLHGIRIYRLKCATYFTINDGLQLLHLILAATS